MDFNVLSFMMAGTFGMIVLVIFVVFMVVSSQKKSLKSQLDLERLHSESERKATLASFRGQESERQRIAKDLHDDICSSLTTIKLGLSFLTEKLDKNKKLQDELLEIRDNLAESIENVRGISHNLMPYALANLGLTKSVEQLVIGLSNPPNFTSSFQASGTDSELKEEVRLMIFRSIKEIINNSLKHSKAANLWVKFVWGQEHLMILIEDNGCGFDYVKTLEDMNSGIGLRNLESRIRIIGASSDVKSDRGGTRYKITVPLSQNTLLA